MLISAAVERHYGVVLEQAAPGAQRGIHAWAASRSSVRTLTSSCKPGGPRLGSIVAAMCEGTSRRPTASTQLLLTRTLVTGT